MVRATMIVEIAGTPESYVKEALSEYMLNLNRMNEVEVHSIKISEPGPIEGSKEMFTCFSESDFTVNNLSMLSKIVFDFMPSSIEITEPPVVSLDSIQATELFNNISGRMHRYDEIAKVANMKIQRLTRMLQQADKMLRGKKSRTKTVKKKSVKKTTPKKAKKATKKKKAKK